MAKELTGFRVAHADLIDVGSGVPESIELDFNFARGEGIAIYNVNFLVGVNEAATSVMLDGNATLSLHVENDALEASFINVAADGFTTDDSEIIAEATIGMIAQDEAATRGGSAAAIAWLSKHDFNFMQMLGSPLVIAINPTFQIDNIGATINIDDGRCTIWYKYVELSDREVRDAFFRRR